MSDTHSPVNVDPQESPIYYFAAMNYATGGRLFPTDIFVNEDEARDCKKNRNTIVAKRRFKPLASPKRFFVMKAHDGAAAGDSPINLPANLSADSEMWFDDTDSFERESGLAEVARLNREYKPSERHFLIELGQPLPMPFGLIEVGQDGMGFAEMRYSYPVCVVRPTVTERARFGA